MNAKTYIATLALAISLAGCNSLFDDAPMNQISEETTWTNNQLLDEYVNSWYRGMSDGFDIFVPSTALFKAISRYYLPWFGDQITVGKTDWFNAGYGDMLKCNDESISLHSSNQWSGYYTQLQYINTFLDNQDKVKDAAEKSRVLGEAHFLRAYYYYMLWRRFGGVLIIDHPYDPLKNAETFPRASYEEMVRFIVSEVDEALNYLPTTNTSANEGRATKGAALMLKAKTYLWASAEVFQNKEKSYLGFTDDQSQAMLQKAKTAYDELFSLGVYKLISINSTTQDGIKDEYRQIFLTKNSAESIFEVQHSDDGDFANKFGHKLDRDAAAPYFTGTTAAYTPTQNHVDEYGMQEGYTYNAKNPYANRDYRFYANVLYDGCTYKGHVMDLHYTNNVAGVDLTAYGTSTSASYSRTGYYMGKFVDETQTIDNDETYASSQNYIIWRYAEALLDYAEVAYRLGDQATALEYVNKIRSRVHMYTHSSITWEQIVNERRVEMAFEETTYWDFFRWGTAVEKLNGKTNPLKAMRVDVKNGNTTYKISNLNRFPGRVRVFDEKEYYYPIPSSEVKYHGVEQNPGWNDL